MDRMDTARALLDVLPGEIVGPIKAGKTVRVDVQIEPLGKSWVIVGVRAMGAA